MSRTHIEILDQLKSVIASEINNYVSAVGTYSTYLETIGSDNVLVEFPDEDNMPRNTMFYINADYGETEAVATTTEQESFMVDVFILCKGKKQGYLVKRAYSFYAELVHCLLNNKTLGGYIEDLSVTGHNFYPDLGATNSEVAIEVHLSLAWAIDY